MIKDYAGLFLSDGHMTEYSIKPLEAPVHCGECRYWYPTIAVCTLSHLSVGPTDYCSKGYREDGGE